MKEQNNCEPYLYKHILQWSNSSATNTSNINIHTHIPRLLYQVDSKNTYAGRQIGDNSGAVITDSWVQFFSTELWDWGKGGTSSLMPNIKGNLEELRK